MTIARVTWRVLWEFARRSRRKENEFTVIPTLPMIKTNKVGRRARKNEYSRSRGLLIIRNKDKFDVWLRLTRRAYDGLIKNGGLKKRDRHYGDYRLPISAEAVTPLIVREICALQVTVSGPTRCILNNTARHLTQINMSDNLWKCQS